MKKKVICITMGMLMVLSGIPSAAFADSVAADASELSVEGVQEMLAESDVSKRVIVSESGDIQNDIEILNAFGYDTDTISTADVTGGDVVYNIETTATDGSADVVEAELSIDESEYGDVTMDFTEGSQKATLEFKSDGKIFLDGDEIIITEATAPSLEGSAIYRTTTVPFGCGSASKYTHYGGTRNWNIEFNNFICKTLVNVCASVIAWGIGGGLGVAIILPISNNIVNYASSTDGKALSAKSKMYYNIDYDRFMISSSQGCRKEYTDFYSTGNYSRKMNSTPLVSYYYFMMPGC